MRIVSYIPSVLVPLLLIGLLLGYPSESSAQSDLSQRPLDHKDYDIWNTITTTNLSRDGKWVAYGVASGKADSQSTLKIRSTSSTKEYVIPLGSGVQFSYDSQFAIFRIAPDREKVKQLQKAKTKPDQMPKTKLQILELATGEQESINAIRSFAMPEENSDWIAYTMEKPSESGGAASKTSTVNETYEVTPEGLKRPEKKLKLKKRETPEEKAKKEAEAKKAKEAKEKAAKEKAAKSEKEEGDEKPKDAEKKNKSVGTTLVLRDMGSGIQQSFPFVTSFSFSKDGSTLAFVTSVEADAKKKPSKDVKKGKDKTAKTSDEEDNEDEEPTDGVHVIELETLKHTQIATGTGNYKGLTFNEEGTQIAFLTNHDDYETKTSTWALYHWKSKGKTAKKIATEGDEGIPDGWWIAPNSGQRFSEDDRRLYFDTAPVPEEVAKERKETANKKAGKKDEDEDDKAKLDVWHWQDPQLQPQQLLQAAQERNRDYRAAYNLKTKKIVQLATKDIPQVSIDYRSESKLAVAVSNMPYRKMMSWDIPGFQDTYLVNLDTGATDKVLDKVKWNARMSPEGKFITWFDAEQRKWFAKAASGKTADPVEISAGIEHPLQNELHDTPSLPRAYGSAGWTADDKAMLIYDRFDIWQVDPKGKDAAIRLTNGRESKIRFRYQRLDREERAIDLDKPMVLSAFDEGDKSSGYSLLTLASKDDKKAKKDKDETKEEETSEPVRHLIHLDERISGLRKSDDSDKVVFTRSTFRMCPDLWSSDLKFKKIQRVSDINPQQDEYTWGTAELVHWDATDGQKLDGILYKPDGFDPAKKYPMMVYFYERNSDNLHAYQTPAAGRSIICHSFYVSRGYLVFVPDIPYKTGEPGPSAANAILPGVQNLIEQGFVDEKKVGMQGHSWGGYQTAYLVTMTDMFACAESGAPVSNMTSAYGGIRWGSGMSRMFQYERTQSRIGEDLWKAREKYIANSPVFFADKINTPLLILHNDEDGAVPWYQGIELFVALRRLEKPAWMLNYNGNPHWVMGNPNRRDFAIRMQQFFDHYLMDAPEPEWMATGVPAVDKGKKFGLDLLEPEKKEASEEESAEETESTSEAKKNKKK